MAKIEPFEKLTERYDRWFEEHAGVYAAELQALRSLLPTSFSRGIEIGVGSGRFAAPLGIDRGVEPSEKMAALARQRGIDVVAGVAESLPLPDASFDLALMVTTICFVDDPLRSLQEMWRILRPGGCCLLGFIDKDTPLGRHYLEHRAESDFYRNARFFAADEVLALLRQAGFSGCHTVQTLFGRDLGELQGDFEPGHGRGAFVAVRCRKGGQSTGNRAAGKEDVSWPG